MITYYNRKLSAAMRSDITYYVLGPGEILGNFSNRVVMMPCQRDQKMHNELNFNGHVFKPGLNCLLFVHTLL